MVLVAFLPSPLLGPATWRPVADLLRKRGWSVTVAGVPRGVSTARDVFNGFADALPHDDELALVAHSNAGLFVPGLADRRDVVAAVLADAAIPMAPRKARLSPPELYAALENKVSADGLLPPWTEWWGASTMEDLVPDPDRRQEVAVEAQRFPLSYFDETVPVPAVWRQIGHAYLAFGDTTYSPELQYAAGEGWPIRVLDGRHLHMVVDPGSVATAVLELLGDLGVTRKSRG